MSTSTPDNNAAAQQPQAPELAVVLAEWVKASPAADATDDVLAAWFDHKARLLAPLADDTTHPDHAQARLLARHARQSAARLRSQEAGR